MTETKKARYIDPSHLLTGSIAGAVSRTVTNPLERLKMLKQVDIGQYKGLSTTESFLFMYRQEGVYGFFKGNGVNVVRIAPFSAFEFFFYEVYKQNLFQGDASSKSSKLFCGGLTGMTASTLTYPLDLIRTKLAIVVDNPSAAEKPSILGCGRNIYRTNGFFGLYQGLFSTLFGIIPYVAFKMASFDILKTFFVVDKNHPYQQLMNLCMGGTAGTISVTLTYPTDLVRRRMQLSGIEGHPQYSSMMNCFARIIQEEGPLALYKGYVACLLKVVPAMAVMFWCNELLKSTLVPMLKRQ